MRAALCHHYDVIGSRDVIGHATIRLSIDDFLYVLNRNQTRISISFHDVIIDALSSVVMEILPQRCGQYIAISHRHPRRLTIRNA